MVLVSASDGVTSDREFTTIRGLVKSLPIFRDFEEHRLSGLAQECAELLRQDEGSDKLLTIIQQALAPHLYETAYWLALEVAISDSRVTLEEIRAIEMLRRALGIDRLAAAAMERGARARYQVA